MLKAAKSSSGSKWPNGTAEARRPDPTGSRGHLVYTTAQASGRAVELSDCEARGPLRNALLESIKTVPVETELRKPGRRNYFSPSPLSFPLFLTACGFSCWVEPERSS